MNYISTMKFKSDGLNAYVRCMSNTTVDNRTHNTSLLLCFQFCTEYKSLTYALTAPLHGIPGRWNFQPVQHQRSFVGVTVLQATTSDATLYQILQLLLAVLMMTSVRCE